MPAHPRVVPLLSDRHRDVLTCIEQVLILAGGREPLAAVRRLAAVIPAAGHGCTRPGGGYGRWLAPDGEPVHVPFALAAADPADIAALAAAARDLGGPQVPATALETVSALLGMPAAGLAARATRLADLLDMMADSALAACLLPLLARAASDQDTDIVLSPADMADVAELAALTSAVWATRM
jgi:hypothetical protein